MANIADGSFEISPATPPLKAAVEAFLRAHPGAFEYGGQSSVELTDEGLRIDFSCRWTCDHAWDALDLVMSDSSSDLGRLLIEAHIQGRGREPAMRYREQIKKVAGANKLRRRLRDW